MAYSSSSSSMAGGEKKHWWLRNRKIVEKYIRDARALMATHEQSDVASAINLLDAALALSPRLEQALELKARSLLLLRRFRDVADMLQDYIPSLKIEDSISSTSSSSSSLSDNSNSSQHLSRERVKLLPSRNSSDDSPAGGDDSVKCFSVSDLKRRVMSGLWKNCEKDGQWRYLVLGQACFHLGLMEDAMVLLQTGKRLANAALRRQSVSWSEDSFSSANLRIFNDVSAAPTPPGSPPRTDSENISQLISHIKLLLRRRTAAIAALDAGLYTEAIRHFSKIVDSRRGAPQGFLAECYTHRALAYRAAGRIAESIADCNRTLALDPSCIQALSTRALLLESIRCFPDSLHDLEHLKLLYNSILRDRKLPGPAWKRHNVTYREIPGKLCALATKMQELKQRIASGETRNVDYYALIGLRRGCSRSELERAHLLLCLRHKPEKAMGFIDRCDFSDDRDLDSIRDRARMSALLLYRLIQKGYSSVMNTIMEEEAVEKQRKKATAALHAAAAVQNQQIQEQPKVLEPKKQKIQEQPKIQEPKKQEPKSEIERNIPKSNPIVTPSEPTSNAAAAAASAAAQFQGVFCRDIAAVSSLLSQVGFNRPLPVKYEALSC